MRDRDRDRGANHRGTETQRGTEIPRMGPVKAPAGVAQEGTGTTARNQAGRAGPFADVTERILGCAIEVHRQLGPGLLESVYEAALCVEFADAGLRFAKQVPVPLLYKGRAVGEYRLDLVVEDAVIVEVKSVPRLDPVFEAQLLTYLRLTGKRVGLLINFHTPVLKAGIKRLVL
jgi:GxxExxY protein